MAVPNTTDFTMEDVRIELGLPSNTNLVACFAAADPDGFNPFYAGSKDSLLNFRDYKEPTVTPTMTLDPQVIPTQSAGSGSFGMTITSNTTWTVTDNASWVTVSPTSGSGNGSITVSYTSNLSGSTRSATITATTTSGSPTASDSTTFSQNAGFQ